MFRSPSSQATKAVANVHRRESRAAATSTGIGAIHVSHETGCNPVPKNRPSPDASIAATAVPAGRCCDCMRAPSSGLYLADLPEGSRTAAQNLSTPEMTRRYTNLVTADLQAVHKRVSLLRT